MAASFAQEKFGQSIQMIFGLSPVTRVGVDQLAKSRAVIVVLEMGKLVDRHVVDAGTGRFDQVGGQDYFDC